jgi:hypothetical protein
MLNVDDVDLIGGRKHGFFPKCCRHDGTRLTPTEEVLLSVVVVVVAAATAAAIAVEHNTLSLSLSLSLSPSALSFLNSQFYGARIPARNHPNTQCEQTLMSVVRLVPMASSRLKRDGMWMDGWMAWSSPLQVIGMPRVASTCLVATWIHVEDNGDGH